MKIGSPGLNGGGQGDSNGVAPRKGGGKMNISNSNARSVKGKKNKGPLSMTKPKLPTTPTSGMGGE